MKLSPDILYWRMKEQLHTVTLQGRNGSDLVLQRPEFYLDRNKVFEKTGCMYAPGTISPSGPALGRMYA